MRAFMAPAIQSFHSMGQVRDIDMYFHHSLVCALFIYILYRFLIEKGKNQLLMASSIIITAWGNHPFLIYYVFFVLLKKKKNIRPHFLSFDIHSPLECYEVFIVANQKWFTEIEQIHHPIIVSFSERERLI